MNELQIKITADLKDLQSALNKAKASLKSFESETAKDKAKSNAEQERTIGLIEEQIQKAKQLKVALSQATNEQDIANFNAQLEQTNAELARLNSLGKSFGGTAVRSFDNLKRSAGAASGAAISFGRIIQDAPFGIIGVANNIQNFGEQFVALGDKSTTAAGKLKLFFSALITPSNLAILAVSALTAAYQAYSLGLFDAKEATDEVKNSIDAYRKSLTESQTSQLEGIKNSNDEIITINSLKEIIEDETLERGKRLKAIEKVNEISPDIFKNLTTEAVLAGKVGDAYEKATRLLIAKATVESDIQKVVSLNDEQKILGDILGKNLKNIEILNKILEVEKLVNKNREEGQTELAIANENTLRYLKNQNPELARILEIESEREKLTKSISDNLKIALEETTKTKVEGEKLNRVFDDQVLLTERFGNLTENNKKKVDSLTESLLKEQKALFETIATLRQEPPNLINNIQLSLAAERLSEIDALIGSIASKRVETVLPDVDLTKIPGFEGPDKNAVNQAGDLPFSISDIETQIAGLEKLKSVTNDSAQLAKYTLEIDNLKLKLQELNGEQVKNNLELVADAFGSLASGIVSSLDISNRSLRGFLTTLISATPKIIAAIGAQADANLANAGKNIAADKAESISSGIKQGTKAAEALGPVGLALLPVFIAGAVAIISSAFSKTSGGGGSVSAGSGSTFTNRREFGGPVSKGRAYIVGERRPELFVPNTNGIIVPQVPSMDYSGTSMSAGAMAIDVNIQGVSYGDDILFTVQQAQIRRGIR
jgi:hypothetical protein